MAANYSLASAAAAAAVVSLAQLVMTKSMLGLAIAFASRCFSFTLGSVIASTRRTELYSVVSYELCIDHINDWSHDRKYLHIHRFVSHVTLSLPPPLSLSLCVGLWHCIDQQRQLFIANWSRVCWRSHVRRSNDDRIVCMWKWQANY